MVTQKDPVSKKTKEFQWIDRCASFWNKCSCFFFFSVQLGLEPGHGNYSCICLCHPPPNWRGAMKGHWRLCMHLVKERMTKLLPHSMLWHWSSDSTNIQRQQLLPTPTSITVLDELLNFFDLFFPNSGRNEKKKNNKNTSS